MPWHSAVDWEQRKWFVYLLLFSFSIYVFVFVFSSWFSFSLCPRNKKNNFSNICILLYISVISRSKHIFSIDQKPKSLTKISIFFFLFFSHFISLCKTSTLYCRIANHTYKKIYILYENAFRRLHEKNHLKKQTSQSSNFNEIFVFEKKHSSNFAFQSTTNTNHIWTHHQIVSYAAFTLNSNSTKRLILLINRNRCHL